MILSIIVAGGTGTRMVTSKVPKQFIKISEKSIIIHTIEKFYFSNKIDKIIVSAHKDWVDFTKELINKYGYQDKVFVCEGGKSRNGSILSALKFIETNYKLDDNDTIITHDAVRMFVSSEIINKNINECKLGTIINTVTPATDTIVKSTDNIYINYIPKRSEYFQGQTPQTFRAKDVFDIYQNQLNYIEFDSTDACKLAELNGNKIKIVLGEKENFKITSEFDISMAEIMVKK